MVRALVEHLPALAPDWRFLLLRHREHPAPLSSSPNVTELVVDAEPNGPLSMWFLPHIVDLGAADLFHAPSNILPLGIPCRTVTTIHDIMWLTDPSLCHSGARGTIERLFYGHGIRRALHRSDAIMTVSEATRDSIAAFSPDAADRTTACLSGVSRSFAPKKVSRSEVARLGGPAGDYVLTVGQHAPYKNHEGAVRAFARAFASRHGIDLVLVQRRSTAASGLEALIESEGLVGRVHFAPALSDSDLVTLYCGATALLHPSLCEGYGMPLAEAMACGCPVVTSNRSAMPEVVGDAALLVDPIDVAAIATALVRIVDEPGLADSLRESGLKRAAQLDWRAFALRHLELYRSLLA